MGRPHYDDRISDATQILTYLVGRGIPFLVLPDPTSGTVDQAARAHGIDPEELVRTEVVIGRHGPALLLVPATRYLDLGLAQRAIDDPAARPATHLELRAIAPSCDVGAIPPLSRHLQAPLYVDPAVADRRQLVFAAGRVQVLVCVEREVLFRDAPYVVAPLAGESSGPRPPTSPPPPAAPSRRTVLSDDSLLPVHLLANGDGDRVNDGGPSGRPAERAVS